jgi:hypothetical protein
MIITLQIDGTFSTAIEIADDAPLLLAINGTVGLAEVLPSSAIEQRGDLTIFWPPAPPEVLNDMGASSDD